MARAFDTAKARLGELHSRDALLDAFFEYTQGFFRIGVLLVVKGATATGRNGRGLEVPLELIQRLSFSLDEPGVLAKSRELRRPFVIAGAMTDSDERLFGSLGRAMHGGIVVPVLVRDRVIAILLGDAVVDVVKSRAAAVGRPPIELVKEEMLLWSTAVGEALERHIVRRKTTGSTPPPPGSVRPPPPSSLAAPRVPVVAQTPVPPRPRLATIGAVAGVATLAALAIVGWSRWNAPPTEATTKPIASKLAGWPGSVDPVAMLEVVRSSAGVPRTARLASLSAEVDQRGNVDFRQPAQSAVAPQLAFTFVDELRAWDLSVDRAGTLRIEPSTCPAAPCRLPVAPPHCTPTQIRAAGGADRVRDDERTLVTYSDRRDEGGTGAEWLLSVGARGPVRLDDRSCTPLPGELLPARAVPLTGVPGAPGDVDPGAIVPLARTQTALAEDAELLEVSATGVRANGRVDFGSPEAAIHYSFGETARPGRRRRFRQIVVGKEGMSAAKDFDATALRDRLGSGTLPPPRCTFAQAYEYMTLGTRAAGGAAHLTYGPDTKTDSGAWSIDIPSAGVRAVVTDATCNTWHSGRELAK